MDEDNELTGGLEATAESSPFPEFAEGFGDYVAALASAWKELEDIKQKEKDLAYRKAKLNETVTALTPLVFKQSWDINALNLSNAIRFVFSGNKRALSALEVRCKLDDLGYDLKQFENPLASIHTALRRMGDTNELRLIPGSTENKKSFEATAELKPVAEPAPQPPNPEALQAALDDAEKNK